jgi:hypothetical protein
MRQIKNGVVTIELAGELEFACLSDLSLRAKKIAHAMSRGDTPNTFLLIRGLFHLVVV